jgi:arsenate reductase
MALTVYGIPTCGTVKKAKSWLDSQKITYTSVDLRANPPERSRVQAWVEAAGSRALRNTSGGSYRALGPEKESWTEAEWVEAFSRDPMLIKRPVIERNGTFLMVGFAQPEPELRKILTE